MAHFTIRRTQPIDDFRNIRSFHGRISKNKFWEIDCYHYSWYWLEIEFEWRGRGHDHAGPELGIGLFGYYINFNIYDHRHWDINTNNWSIYHDE